MRGLVHPDNVSNIARARSASPRPLNGLTSAVRCAVGHLPSPNSRPRPASANQREIESHLRFVGQLRGLLSSLGERGSAVLIGVEGRRTKRHSELPICDGSSQIGRPGRSQAEEAMAVPACACHRLGDLRQAAVGLAIPGEALSRIITRSILPFHSRARRAPAFRSSLSALSQFALRKDASPMIRAFDPSAGAGRAASLCRPRRTPWPGCDRLGSS